MTKIIQLTKKMRERIRSGEWGQEQSLPTRSFLAEEYGVAPGTISQVFRNLEQEGLVRVLPRKGVIITDPNPINQPVKENVAIGVRGSYLRSGHPGGYGGSIMNQLLEAAEAKGIPVLILPKREGEGPLTRKRCEELGVQGVIYLGEDYGGEARKLCLEGFPVISSTRTIERSPVNYIECDHVGLLHDVVERYSSFGHSRIAVIHPPTQVPHLLEQLKPHFIEALLLRNIQYDILPYWVSLKHGETEAYWIKQIEALFELEKPPTAFLCWSVAVELLLGVLKSRNLVVPKDASILYTPIRCPDYPDISGFSNEQQNFGKRLLDGVIAQIQNPFYFVQDELPFEFIDRGSVAQAPGFIPS